MTVKYHQRLQTKKTANYTFIQRNCAKLRFKNMKVSKLRFKNMNLSELTSGKPEYHMSPLIFENIVVCLMM